MKDPEDEDVNSKEAEAERVEEAIEYFTKVGKDDTPTSDADAPAP